VILMYLLTAAVIGPLAFIVTGRWTRRRRVLLCVAAVALLWVAETAFIIMVGDEAPAGSRSIDPREFRR
jgi:predicted MFS family arabinose efflux permease